MIYKKWPAFILFAVSFVVLSISGYQCSTRVTPTTSNYSDFYKKFDNQTNSQNNSQSNTQENLAERYENFYRGNSNQNNSSQTNLKSTSAEDEEEPKTSCPRRQLRNLAKNEGTYAMFDISSSSLQDFRLGRSANYDNACSRLYLDMNKAEYQDASVYEGSMSIVYVGTCLNGQYGICRSRTRTGYSTSDARYNKWTGSSWEAGNNNKIDKKFHAIFEDDNGYGAYILKLEDVRLVDIADGQVAYIGGGQIYFKMFRTATSGDVHRKDVAGDCYNNGTYISLAQRAPNRPSNRCWFLNTGPYNCRPQGDLLISAAFKDVDITDDYKCYKKLGTFYYLDIEKAFNDVVGDLD